MAAAGVLGFFIGAADARDEGAVLVPKNLAAARERLDRGDAALRPALDALLAEAEGLLRKVPPSVLDKAVVGPSGDRRDYFSVSPCWWPDPAQPKGRPYVWQDGEPNPGNRAGRTDPVSFGRMCDSVETLALAYHFTDRERYAKKAAQFIRVWFLDPASGMNPHLRFAETIPGRPDRLNNGIIEFRHIVRCLDAVELLGNSYAWPAQEREELKAWLATYFHWLTTSEQGRAEQAMPNFHGSWYDVQVARLALALGRNDEARAIVEAALTIRVGLQILPDGSQPLEQVRANAMAGAISNVEALLRLGFVADQVKVDWWRPVLPGSASVVAAFRYLVPFADPKVTPPWGDCRSTDRSRLEMLLIQGQDRFAAKEIREMAARISETSPQTARWRLLWPEWK